MTPAIYAVVFLALGIVLLGIEMVLIPGFGLVGLAGVGAMLYGGWIAWENYGPVIGVSSVVGGGIVATSMFVFFMRSGWSKRMVLQSKQHGEPSALPEREESLVGQVGVAATDLRPAGIVRLGGRRTDVVAEDGAYVEAGTEVVVVKVAQNSIVVRVHEPEGASIP